MLRRFGPLVLTILSVALIALSFLAASSQMHGAILALAGLVFGTISNLLVCQYRVDDLEEELGCVHQHLVECTGLLERILERTPGDKDEVPPTAP